MPNLCETTYRCVGEPKEIGSLYKILQKMNRRKKPKHPNGWGGTLWLGELVTELGFDWQQYRCRGEIIDYQKEDKETLMIAQSTAWCEQEGVRECIEKKFPGIKVYWQDMEPGCDNFITSSFDYFPDQYYLDSYEDPMYFETIEEAHKYIESLVGHSVEATFEDLDSAVNQYQEEQEEKGIDCFWSFHEFTLVEGG